jgi:hypothetical protein
MLTTFGARWKIERSSFVSYPAVWVFVRNSPTGPVKGALHLDIQNAIELRDRLSDFIENN